MLSGPCERFGYSGFVLTGDIQHIYTGEGGGGDQQLVRDTGCYFV